MPFRSVAQQHFLEAHPEKLGKAGLKEWESSTNYHDLPAHVHKSASYKAARKVRKDGA